MNNDHIKEQLTPTEWTAFEIAQKKGHGDILELVECIDRLCLELKEKDHKIKNAKSELVFQSIHSIRGNMGDFPESVVRVSCTNCGAEWSPGDIPNHRPYCLSLDER